MEYIEILQSIWTVVAMIVFFAITLWAWSSRRKEEFEEAAKLALDDSDETLHQITPDQEKYYG